MQQRREERERERKMRFAASAMTNTGVRKTLLLCLSPVGL